MISKKNKKEIIKKVKGMHDILPEKFLIQEKFIKKAQAIADHYGFQPIQTPILEKLELFSTAVGENTDIVEKEMYSLKTKGGNKLVLRPEGTAPIVRAYIEHGMQTKPQPVMFYYYGSFFRHENPQKNRRREFQQFGLEILGEKDSITDATVIKTALTIIEEVGGIKPLSVSINSIGCKQCRKTYLKELTAHYRKRVKQLCENCNRRLKLNPLRLLDCKECLETKKEAPQITNSLCEECKNHFKELLEILDNSEVPYYLDPYLVRGLDYYSRTIFEIFPKEEDSSALAGGGRYDYLGFTLGNKDIPAVGCALGIDRIIKESNAKTKLSPTQKITKVFFIQLGPSAKQKSLYVLEVLRKAKIPTQHSLNKSSLKSQLKIASKLKAAYALILGQKEVLGGNIIVKNMETTSQETIAISKLTDYLKKKKI